MLDREPGIRVVKSVGAIALAVATVVAAGCNREGRDGEARVEAPPITDAQGSAGGPAADGAAGAGQPGRSVSGLRLPLPGDVFTIGDEKWEVVAAETAVPADELQQDTRIIDVTISARRQGAQEVEYLGADEPPPQPEREPAGANR